ncbi:MAG TPA: hypothetical protein EYQ31_05540 [Candidatus Handelsmanbacteria bacterium]|nr:hypothetical protein [Candidatus Handelsmanbacteria bacterium]
MLGSGFLEAEHHEVSWAVRESIRYLRHERPTDKPFFLNCSFFGPHQPYLCPPPWDALYPEAEIPLPADFHYSVEDKPLFRDSAQMEWLQRRDRWGWDEGTYRRLLAAYYGYVSMIDDGVGQLLAAVREEGLWDDTLIVFSADHGEFGGQFRAFYKGLPYEGSCHVPLIVHDPRAPSGGRRCDRNTSNIDLFSTFLQVAGVALPEHVESRDLAALVAGEETAWDNRSLWKKGGQSFLVRDDDKLVRGEVGTETVYELYDLGRDPMEEHNVFAEPARQQRLVALRAELDAWHAEQLDKRRGRRG